jgi:hypothetical protein
VREKPTLLVLDGIEPLPYPPGRPEIEGRLKDPGLATLLKGLAAGNPGLCVVTTRERIADLAGSPSTAAGRGGTKKRWTRSTDRELCGRTSSKAP